MLDLNSTNFCALLKLLDESDENDLIMKAEVYRNPGQFEESKRHPDRINYGDLMQINGKILVEINKQNMQVFQLF